MSKVAGIKLKANEKEYFYSIAKLDVAVGDFVIVDTPRGREYGKVFSILSTNDKHFPKKLPMVLSKVTDEQLKKIEEFLPKANELRIKAIEEAKRLNLDIKIAAVDVSLTDDKLLIYFSTESKIEFSITVKALATVLKSRVELKQVGQRDTCRIIGGVGMCGMELCCCGFVSNFPQVTIKMAKSQNLAINPQKISGACGRLKCCLAHEVDTYEEISSRMPKKGTFVKARDGREGIVNAFAYLKETIKLKAVDKDGVITFHTYPLSEIIFKNKPKEEQPLEQQKKK